MAVLYDYTFKFGNNNYELTIFVLSNNYHVDIKFTAFSSSKVMDSQNKVEIFVANSLSELKFSTKSNKVIDFENLAKLTKDEMNNMIRKLVVLADNILSKKIYISLGDLADILVELINHYLRKDATNINYILQRNLSSQDAQDIVTLLDKDLREGRKRRNW